MYINISSLFLYVIPPEAKKALRRSPPGGPPGRARREALRGKTKSDATGGINKVKIK